jgi:hypothetical protein
MKETVHSVKSSIRWACLGAAMLAAGIPTARAQSVGVHFLNDTTGGVVTNTTESAWLSPSDSAGPAPYTQANWNNLCDHGSGVTLTNSTGDPTALTIAWDGNWVNSGGTAASLGTPDGKLMDGAIRGNQTIVDYTALSAYTNVSSMPWNAKPMVYLGGLQAWCQSVGAEGYAVVIYQVGYGWWDSAQMWVESVTGSSLNDTMLAGPDLTPHYYNSLNAGFNGTWIQIPTSATSEGSKNYNNANYGVFNGLTNDAILIRTGDTDDSWGNGCLNGFQIVAVYPTLPLASDPTFSPSSTVYAGVPVTLSEVATGDPVRTNLWYQWVQDKNSDHNVTNVIAGATNTTYSFIPPNAVSTYTISFDVIVTNFLGASTSSVVTLTVNPAVPPYTTKDTTPGAGNGCTSVYAFLNGSVTFSAAFAGPVPLTNQWQADTGSGYVSIPNTTSRSDIATTWSVTVTNLHSTDAGNYRALANNAYGSVASTPSPLTVQADPAPPSPSEPYAYRVFSDGPAAYWRFSETLDNKANSVQAYDYSGHNRNATYGITAYDNQAGPQSPALPGFESGNTGLTLLNAIDNCFVIAPDLNLNTNTVTISAWINPSGVVGAYWGLLAWVNGSDKAAFGFGSTVNSNTSVAELGYTWDTNSASTYNFHSGLYPLAGQWSYVALVITPTNSTIYLYYVDASTGATNMLKSVQNITNSVESFTGGTIWIGSDSYSGRNFNGSIDELAVFARSLSEAEIGRQFITGLGVSGVAPVIKQQPASPHMTFAGQTVSMSADGSGYPAPSFQWQAGTGGVFHDLANDSHISDVHSGTLTIKTTIADAQDYRVVLNNPYGSVTSQVATVTLAPIPVNGIWTVNYAIVTGNGGAPSTAYSGPGVLGNGTFWNAMTGSQFASSTSFCDDGVTVSGIRISSTGYPGSWYEPNTSSPLTKLLDPYVNTQTAFVITNLPNGTYNLVVFGMSGTYLDNSRGTRFTVNGVSKDNVFQQDVLFAPGDNSALFENVHVTSGGLLIDETPIGYQSDGVTLNTEPDFNGAQIQAVSLDPVTLTASSLRGSLTLSWANYGTLLSATNLAGPWGPEAGALSPFSVNPTNAAKFFRVKIH